MDKIYDSTLTYLMRLCSGREYCRSEVMQKALTRLARGGENPDAESLALQIVDKLTSDGFLDQGRYAAAFARDKATITGWGPVKIAAELRRKGIDKDIISEAMSSIDGAKAEDRLRRSAIAKYRMLEGDPAWKLKLLRFILSKGYDYTEAQTVVSSFE